MPANPFKPTFGASPPLLAGRDDLIEEFTNSLLDGPGAPGRATLYAGARGAGKTVMLNEAEDAARAEGWLVVSETASPGVIERLTQSRLPALLRDLDPKAVRKQLTGIQLPIKGGALEWETLEAHVVKTDLRQQITLLTDLLAENATGLMVTLDEVHRNQIDELREFGTVVQHAFREDRELAVALAGLTHSVRELVNDNVLTFLRRADRYTLGAVDRDEVRRALQQPIEDGGRRVDEDALDAMVAGTEGYPFMIQLVGSSCWRAARQSDTITVDHAQRGLLDAQRRLGSLVHAPPLEDASEIDRSFLLAMTEDDGPSRIADIRKRLGVTSQYASIYRLRLIDAELIRPAGHGRVEFTLPHLREYIREHAAAQI